MDTVTIARVNGDGIVTNIEVATQEWLDDARTLTADALIPYDETNPAGIGWTYDADKGTFTPPPLPTPYTEGMTDE